MATKPPTSFPSAHYLSDDITILTLPFHHTTSDPPNGGASAASAAASVAPLPL